ncbi:MAG: Pyruvate kinase [candidate division WS6 bacterium GW2011_GWC2_36_7]|uniref:Pyruvate kinase n=1 Tax=candidate division WS6 bacterium GW2011_GWC2_36_7 TaxID=1619091 RepID=A0A0G0I6A2_9BACT|nr:MAG: Pyruvate kinase [candidate division WS6 bacterium GW2011_GWC2_36_7]
MKNYSKTKIIATIGPSSWDAPVLKEMYSAGMDIARINASFADFAELERVSNTLRTTSPRIGIMLDTQGHKIRVTGLEHEIQIEGEISIPNTFDITYPDLYKDVSVGTRILLDDGNIQLVVKAIQDIEVICTVIQPGILKPNKTVNIPDVNLNFPAITEKDKADILFAVEHRFDFLSLSFVRNREDILTVRELIGDSNIKLIAKIENVQGVENFDEILAATDAIMIARGDLGIEIPFEKVPILQKQFIYKCRQAGKPVIVATQMLESMKESIQPTRAEISDVANAVISAETSTGRNPVVAVATMQKIAKEAESVLQQSPIYGHTSAPLEVDELCRNLCDISESMKLKGIVVISNTGQTVLSLSRHRPNAPIWEISSSLEQIRHDSLLNGVTGFFLKDLPQDRDECTQHAVEVVYAQGELDLNDKVAIISGSSIRHNTTDAILEIVQVKNVLSR